MLPLGLAPTWFIFKGKKRNEFITIDRRNTKFTNSSKKESEGIEIIRGDGGLHIYKALDLGCPL